MTIMVRSLRVWDNDFCAFDAEEERGGHAKQI